MSDFAGIDPKGARWCPHCNGYGSSLKEASARCTHCGGSGLVAVADPEDAEARTNGSDRERSD